MNIKLYTVNMFNVNVNVNDNLNEFYLPNKMGNV